jgi:hypothetical protein
MSKKVITIIIIVAVVIAFVGIMATLQENGVIDDVTTEAPKQEEKATEAPKLEKDPILDEIGFNDPQKVNNDKTGNWRISTCATTKSDEEYIIPYIKYYMADAEGTYAIVNFTNKVTIAINKSGSIATVDVHEYVDKEEHDAAQLFSGQVLSNYIVHLDTEQIEKE